jgi:hypothetical protein
MSILRRPRNALATLTEPVAARRLGAAIDRVPWESRFLVAGMRRSGNHAVIGWLANALQAESDLLTYDYLLRFGQSESGNTVHINDISLFPLSPQMKRRIFQDLRGDLSALDSGKRLIISIEDVGCQTLGDLGVPVGGTWTRVLVKRSVLNLLASRLAFTKSTLEQGGSVPQGMRINQNLLDRIAGDLTAAANGWNVIDFDRWSTGDSAYRAEILEGLGLSVDIDPAVTVHGDGSSFTGSSIQPESFDLLSRWKLVEWPDDVLDLLALERNRAIMTEVELDHLRELRRTS